MKTILYMTISADGFIADTQGATPWGDASWESFNEFVRHCDVVLLGRRTYEIMKAQDEFIDGPRYIVVTTDVSLDTGAFPKLSVRSKADLPDVKTIGVIGGGELNGRLAELNLIDEIILDVEPIVLGQGHRLFGDHTPPFSLELIESRRIGPSTVQNHYRTVVLQP